MSIERGKRGLRSLVHCVIVWAPSPSSPDPGVVVVVVVVVVWVKTKYTPLYTRSPADWTVNSFLSFRRGPCKTDKV